MPRDNDYGFWDDAPERSPTGPIPRLTRITRPRSVTSDPTPPGERAHRARTFEDDAYSRDAWFEHEAAAMWSDEAAVTNDPSTAQVTLRSTRTERHPNFVMRRIAALVAIGVVAAPIALLIGGGGERGRDVADGAVSTTSTDLAVAQPQDVAAPLTTLPAVGVAPVTSAVSAASPVASVAVSAPTSSAADHAAAADASATTAPTVPAAPVTDALADSTPVATSVVTTQPAGRAEVQAVDVEQTLATAAVVATSAQPVRASCANEYDVVVGDYWILIADKVSVTVDDLLEANGASTATPLYPERTICLPAGASAPTTAAPTTAAPTTAAPTTTDAPTTTAKATTTAPPTTAPPTTVRASTTTAAPTTTAATPIPPKNAYTRAEITQIIRNVWPDELEDEAIRIATRESNLVPTVRNYCCYGLFQLYWGVHKGWMNEAGVTSAEQLYDPTVNAYLAYAMYLRAGGWGPWQ